MFLIYLSIIGITTFFIIFGYINQLNLYEEEEYEKLQALASSLAINIDGDLHNKLMKDHPWKDDITSIDENAQYFEIHSMLRKVHEQNKLNTPLYTLLYSDEEEIFYYGVRSDLSVYFRHEYEMFPEILLEKMNEGGTIPRYKTENGKILPSRITNVSQKKQRELSLSIKRARNLALL